MGIKFKCPQGHKIHVKAFLAGKRAICPHCGEKVTVPLASTNDLAGAVAAAAAMPTTDLAESPDDDAPVVTMAGGVAPGATAGFATLGPSVPEYQPAAAAMPATTVPAASAHSAATAADPIAEAPLAVWYVRPRAGGQFGPAPGEMFRRWLAEGRVAADALVWREGWPDWKVAVSVFSSLAVPATGFATATPVAAQPMPPTLPMRGPSPSPSVAPTMPAMATISPTASGMTGGDGMDLPPLSPRGGGAYASTGYTATGRRGSKTGTLVIIAMLAVVALSLLGVLAYVVSRG